MSKNRKNKLKLKGLKGSPYACTISVALLMVGAACGANTGIHPTTEGALDYGAMEYPSNGSMNSGANTTTAAQTNDMTPVTTTMTPTATSMPPTATSMAPGAAVTSAATTTTTAQAAQAQAPMMTAPAEAMTAVGIHFKCGWDDDSCHMVADADKANEDRLCPPFCGGDLTQGNPAGFGAATSEEFATWCYDADRVLKFDNNCEQFAQQIGSDGSACLPPKVRDAAENGDEIYLNDIAQVCTGDFIFCDLLEKEHMEALKQGGGFPPDAVIRTDCRRRDLPHFQDTNVEYGDEVSEEW